MKRYISKSIVLLALALTGFAITFQNAALAVDCSICSNTSDLTTQQAIQCGTDCAGGNQNTGQAATNVDDTIASIVNILSAVVGIIAVIMIIVAGFKYITSGGTSEKITSAKNTLIYAVIGLVIVALAQVIVQFVLQKTVAPSSPTNSNNCPNGQTVC